GGLHHLLALPTDLERTVDESRRILRPGGRFVVVEPWETPFLRLVHWTSQQSLARHLSSKLDAFATMVSYERITYEQWLKSPAVVLDVLRDRFPKHTARMAWGKIV